MLSVKEIKTECERLIDIAKQSDSLSAINIIPVLQKAISDMCNEFNKEVSDHKVLFRQKCMCMYTGINLEYALIRWDESLKSRYSDRMTAITVYDNMLEILRDKTALRKERKEDLIEFLTDMNFVGTIASRAQTIIFEIKPEERNCLNDILRKWEVFHV